MRKMKRWKSTFGVLALALLLTVSLAPTAAFADAAAAGGTAAGEAAGQPAASASTPAPDNQAVDNKTEKRIEEPAVDKSTTAPNNVNTAAPSDDKQGSDISYQASLLGILPVANSTATITPEDANRRV